MILYHIMDRIELQTVKAHFPYSPRDSRAATAADFSLAGLHIKKGRSSEDDLPLQQAARFVKVIRSNYSASVTSSAAVSSASVAPSL